MKIISIQIDNLSGRGVHCGEAIPFGTLGIVIDSVNFDVYEKLGEDVFFSKDGELLDVFAFRKDSKEGFAGREIKLRIKEPSVMFPKIQAIRECKFKGSLWRSDDANQKVAEHLGKQILKIGVRERNDRGNTFFCSLATEDLYKHLSKLLVIAEPDGSDFNADLKEPSHG